MVASQFRSGSHQARVLGVGGEEEKETECLNWFPPAEAALKRTLIQNIMSVLLRSRPPGVSPAACNGGDGSF